MSDPGPSYLPPEIVVYIRDRVDLDPATRWEVERVAERAYADGYREGHERGYTAAWVARDRELQRAAALTSALPPQRERPPIQGGHPPWTP